MKHRRYRLTAEIGQQILGFIRAGTYDWVAAEAVGIPRRTYRQWLRRGATTGRQPYRGFYQDVMQAKAVARLRVEVEVREKDPRFWLSHGPGREAADRPGWTNPVKPASPRRSRAPNPLTSPHWRELWATILSALAPFPEARAVLVQALAALDTAAPLQPASGTNPFPVPPSSPDSSFG